MKEIKFRAWETQAKKYIELVGRDAPIMFFDGSISFPESGWDINGPITPPEKQNIIVEQFTGMRDSESKEIYENDIVKHSGITGLQEPCLIVLKKLVSWDENKNGWNLPATINLSKKNGNPWLVIGNIHENPELLI